MELTAVREILTDICHLGLQWPWVITWMEINLGMLIVRNFREALLLVTKGSDKLPPQAPESHIQPLTEYFPLIFSNLTWRKPRSLAWTEGRMLVYQWWVWAVSSLNLMSCSDYIRSLMDHFHLLMTFCWTHLISGPKGSARFSSQQAVQAHGHRAAASPTLPGPRTLIVAVKNNAQEVKFPSSLVFQKLLRILISKNELEVLCRIYHWVGVKHFDDRVKKKSRNTKHLLYFPPSKRTILKYWFSTEL